MEQTSQRFSAARERTVLGLDRCGPKRRKGAFTFVQLADTQLGMMDGINSVQYLRRVREVLHALTCNTGIEKSLLPIPELKSPTVEYEIGRLIEVEKELARRAVRAINGLSPRPAFAVVCGDLVHSYPARQPEAHAAEVAEFKAIFSEVHPDISLICVCGNHDVGDRPTAATIATWRHNFGDDYFCFYVGGVKFICLNSQLYKDGSAAADLAAQQDRWLDAELSLASSEDARRVVVFSHHPPFIQTPDEGSGYFPLAKEVRLRLLTKMARYGVTHWFCGHYHRNAGGIFCLPCDEEPTSPSSPRQLPGGRGATLEVVTTAAVGANIGTDPAGDPMGLSGMLDVAADPKLSGVRVVEVSEHTLSHRFLSLEELEARSWWG